MCVRPPSAARSARAERAAMKAAGKARGSRGGLPVDRESAVGLQLPTRVRSCSNLSTTSSSWSPTGMLTPHETVSGRWVEDAAARTCAKCERVFSLVNRRHHCRVCGEIFCHACSRTRMVLATNPGEIPRRQRVCDPCAQYAHPCAQNAHSSTVLYDAEDMAFGSSDSTSGARSLSRTRLSATELVEGADLTEELLLAKDKGAARRETQSDSSMSFLLASIMGFAAAFWFLKDEVAFTNPAVWILLAGLVKNVYELLRKTGLPGRGFTGGVLADEDAEQVFSGMDLDATDDGLSTATTTTTTASMGTGVTASRFASVKISPAQRDEMIKKAQSALDTVLELAMSEPETDSAWTPEVATTEDVTLFSRDGKPARVFKSEAEIALSPDELFDELHGNFESSDAWNVTAAENHVVRQLDETTDIVQVVSAPALGGMISSRDFVNTRSWRRQDGGGYLVASTCAGKNVLKTQKGVTRGENGPTGFLILPHPSSPFKSRLIWILNCDIKGYFPSSVIRKGSISEVSCFVRNLRRYLAANAVGAADQPVSEHKLSEAQ